MPKSILGWTSRGRFSRKNNSHGTHQKGRSREYDLSDCPRPKEEENFLLRPSELKMRSVGASVGCGWPPSANGLEEVTHSKIDEARCHYIGAMKVSSALKTKMILGLGMRGPHI